MQNNNNKSCRENLAERRGEGVLGWGGCYFILVVREAGLSDTLSFGQRAEEGDEWLVLQDFLSQN